MSTLFDPSSKPSAHVPVHHPESPAMSPSLEVIEWRLRTLEEDRRRFADALEVLARLEQHHETTRQALADTARSSNDHEDRIRQVEAVVPVLRLTSGWIVAGVLACCGMFATSLWQAVAGPIAGH